MQNPQTCSQPLSPRDMFSYDGHTNIPWNMTQYSVPVLHHDQKKVIRDRMYASQKKGVKVNDYYVTRKGFYMNYELQQAKGVPSSVVHIDAKPWDGTKTVLEPDALKKMRQTKKNTYLQRIERIQQIKPVPGITTYRMEKSIDQQRQEVEKLAQKDIKYGEKRFYHEDNDFVSQKVPGPGNYCPHDDVENLKKSIGDWKYWTKKHQKLNKIVQKRESKAPAPGSYTPLYRSYNSFEVLQTKSPKQKMIRNGFGSDARFPYVRPNKKVIIEKRPAPSRYETKIDWKGKSVSPKKKQWIKMLWTGSPPKVYN